MRGAGAKVGELRALEAHPGRFPRALFVPVFFADALRMQHNLTVGCRHAERNA